MLTLANALASRDRNGQNLSIFIVFIKKENVYGAEDKLDTDGRHGRLHHRCVSSVCAEDCARWRLR